MEKKINLPIYETTAIIRKELPLIHHITNWVSISDCANITRLIGGLPIMAHAEEEVADMVSLSNALVLNIGTLTSELVKSMIIAAKAANKKGIPVILDSVGVGATAFRDRKAMEILAETHIDVIKGNASEIAKLAGKNVITRGVESTIVQENLVETAMSLSKSQNATVVITGKEDIIANDRECYIVKNGNEMMGKIVGTGCMASSVIATYCSIENNYAKAAAIALSNYEIAAEKAFKKAQTPFAFKTKFFDEIYLLDKKVEDLQEIFSITKQDK